MAALLCLVLLGQRGMGAGRVDSIAHADGAGPEITLRSMSDGEEAFVLTWPHGNEDFGRIPADQWPRIFHVKLSRSGEGSPSLPGNYELRTDGALVLRLRFPRNTRLDHDAFFEVETWRQLVGGAETVGEMPGNSSLLVRRFPGEMPDMTPEVRVMAVYPGTRIIPENNLKFYIQFSGPMSRGRSYEHLVLKPRSGEALELPFLELDEELWSPDGTRLTVFIDPGRIKQGLKPREDAGPVLQAGQEYELSIDAAWQDAAGRTLIESFEKSYHVGASDTLSPQVGKWIITAPRAESRAALQVDFDEVLDHALLQRLLWV